MNNVYFMRGFFGGSIFTLILTVTVFAIISRDRVGSIVECQKSLPRDQYCILIAVPATAKPEGDHVQESR